MSVAYQSYVETMERQLSQLYALSDSARLKGLDPSLKTECIIAQDIADLVEGLVGPKGVAASIRELSTKLGREEIAFKIAEQIVYGKFDRLEPEPAAETEVKEAKPTKERKVDGSLKVSADAFGQTAAFSSVKKPKKEAKKAEKEGRPPSVQEGEKVKNPEEPKEG